MSFNGSGTFVINSAGQPVVSGTVISSTAFNALTADLANGLSTCITKDGQTTPTADIPMGSNKITGLGNGTAAGDAANLGQVQSTVAKLLGSVSGADTITAVGSPTVAAYAAGQMFYFVAAGANTGAVTINVDSLGAKSITRDGTTALAAGDIQSGEVCVIVYDGTQFQLVNGASQSAAIVTNSLTVNGTSSLDGAVTINDSGADVDFRVEGDTDANLLFVDASTDRVGFGTNTPATKVDVQKSDGSGRQDLMRILAGGNSSGNGATLALGSTQTQAGYISGLQTASNEGALVFGVQSSGAYAERARIDSAGNLGLGVTPSAWTSFSAFQASRGSFAGNTVEVDISHNAFFDGAWKYIADGFATNHYQTNGTYVWRTAPSGTAGNTITFTQAMTLDASGNLLLGTTTAHYATSGRTVLNINGSTSSILGLQNGNDTAGYLYADSGTFVVSTEDARSMSLLVTGSAVMTFGTNNTERARITAGGDFLVAKTAIDAATDGCELRAVGIGIFTCSGDNPLVVNRKTNDGTLVSFRQDSTEEGTISVSGNTVSYNAFAGSHWSQLQDGSKPDILRGTVMESINELCEWPGEDNERLPKCKISDTAGSKKVYGVFMAWDNDWETTNDMYVTAVGAFICRVNADVTVQEGDLLESNGDGTARVQADDLIRSSTIGKVTSTVKTHEYDDGSYCVPTVLYCG